MRQQIRAVLRASALASLASATIVPGISVAQDAASESGELEELVVTGTRVTDRTRLDSLAPVDVLSAETLTRQGSTELAQALSTVAPSLNFPRPAITDGTDHIRPATLRGLAPDQTLVLVNSKRRHQSALVNVNGSVGRGSSAVDLNAIPLAAIKRIEVLRDGASAQYGSDAIAGVINIVLKKNEDEGTNGAFAIGAGKGDRYRLNLSALLNHKANKWNFGVAYDNWYTTRTRSVKGDRINYDLPDEYYLTQRRFDERLIFYQNAKVTVDHEISKKSSLNLEALWAFPGENNNETLKNTYQTSEGDFTSQNQRHSNEIRRSHALDFSLRYSKRFDTPDKLLLLNLSNTFGNDKENTDITTQYLTEQDDPQGEPFLQRTHTYQKTNLFNLAGDYIEPVASNGLIETGYK